MKPAILGLDTSNYRTSICVIDTEFNILFEQKELLPVALGEKGMMQSEALFHHIKRLPELIAPLPNQHFQWLAIGASIRPRPMDHSYMPVFLCGESIARFISSFLHIPFFQTSHQEGHIAAGEFSLGLPIKTNHFLAVHLSGGTSELLHVERVPTGYKIERMGGSIDLHAGQLIDRIGVMMNLPFPSGPYLEQLAVSAKGILQVPSSVNGYSLSFSGPEAALKRYIEANMSAAEIARATEQVIANTLEKVLRKAIQETGIKDVLLVGGVAANQHIRKRLVHRLEHPAVDAKLFFTSPEYSGDNAFGVACLTLQQLKHEH